jgi:hypothetical protein
MPRTVLDAAFSLPRQIRAFSSHRRTSRKHNANAFRFHKQLILKDVLQARVLVSGRGG